MVETVNRSYFNRAEVERIREEKSREFEAMTVLDELFKLTRQYKNSAAYFELVRFIARFRHYSPFNAMLVHIQMPGARFFNSAKRWHDKFNRLIKVAAKPLMILRPGGPIMLVYDVADTEQDKRLPAVDIPDDFLFPFEATAGKIESELNQTIDNCRRDLIEVRFEHFGSQLGGRIRQLSDITDEVRKNWNTSSDARYLIELSNTASRESQFVSLLHELAHLYCGHLGTPNAEWWPDRSHLSHAVKEFEAESVAYIACARAGLKNQSELYLAGYLQENDEIPDISFDQVIKAAFHIESMWQRSLPPRVNKKTARQE